MAWVWWCGRYRVRLWWDRGLRCCSEDHALYSRQKTQLGLNALYTGPEFPYAINYANAQMIVFVSFSLSAGMPIMYVNCLCCWFVLSICGVSVVFSCGRW